MEKVQRVKILLAFGEDCLSNVSNFLTNPFAMSFAEECQYWLTIAESIKIILQRLAFYETIDDDKFRQSLISFVGRCNRLHKIYGLNCPHLVYRHNVDKQIFDWE